MTPHGALGIRRPASPAGRNNSGAQGVRAETLHLTARLDALLLGLLAGREGGARKRLCVGLRSPQAPLAPTVRSDSAAPSRGPHNSFVFRAEGS